MFEIHFASGMFEFCLCFCTYKFVARSLHLYLFSIRALSCFIFFAMLPFLLVQNGMFPCVVWGGGVGGREGRG